MNNKHICLLDFETTTSSGDISGHTDEPVQLCAVIIHPRKLEIVEGSEFSSFIKLPDKFQPTDDSLSWHAKIRKCTKEQVIEQWNAGPDQKTLWDNFMSYLERYHTPCKKKSMFSAPILAGWNSISYDAHIFNRMCERFGYIGKDKKQNVVLSNIHIDIMHDWFMWTENNQDVEKNTLDIARGYLGLSAEGAHDAIKDVKDCAAILIRLMRLRRWVAERVNMKGSFSQDE